MGSCMPSTGAAKDNFESVGKAITQMSRFNS